MVDVSVLVSCACVRGAVDDGVFLVRVRVRACARWVCKMKKSMRCPEMKMYATTRVCTQFLLEKLDLTDLFGNLTDHPRRRRGCAARLGPSEYAIFAGAPHVGPSDLPP